MAGATMMALAMVAVTVPGLGVRCAAAQSGEALDSARDSLYLKAQEMVVNGDATTGRKLVDSLVNATSPDSAQYAEALYWHATLAASASVAEQDYRRIIVDYPLSPRVDDALLRMGQLELTRGEYDAALQHLQRVAAEHPQSRLRARANYWLARAYFERNDPTRACAANTDAASLVSGADVELKNQIEYQRQQCRSVVAKQTAESAAARADQAKEKPSAQVAAKPAERAARARARKSAEPPAETPTPASQVARGDNASHDVAQGDTPPESVSTAGTHQPASDGSAVEESVPSVATPAGRTAKMPHTKAVKSLPAVGRKATADAASPATRTPSAASGTFSVQVAAYYDRPQADALAAKLRGRGYQSRVDGRIAPFRVRIGHYPSRAAATTALSKLKAKHITGFVIKE